MATSSIGQVVRLDDETAKRIAEICAKPPVKAKGPNGSIERIRDKEVLGRLK